MPSSTRATSERPSGLASGAAAGAAIAVDPFEPVDIAAEVDAACAELDLE